MTAPMAFAIRDLAVRAPRTWVFIVGYTDRENPRVARRFSVSGDWARLEMWTQLVSPQGHRGTYHQTLP